MGSPECNVDDLPTACVGKVVIPSTHDHTQKKRLRKQHTLENQKTKVKRKLVITWNNSLHAWRVLLTFGVVFCRFRHDGRFAAYPG